MPADTIILLRGGSAAAWEEANPVLSEREPGIETDTRKMKVGDGSTAWNSLPYFGTNGVDGEDGTDGVNADITRTSPTSNTIGTGSKTFAFATSTNLGWVVGSRLRASNSATNFVEGVVTAVSSTSVTIDADTIGGSGTHTSWSIAIAGERGQTGAAGANGTNGANGAAGANGLNADMTRTSTSTVTVGINDRVFTFAASGNLGWIVGTRLRATNMPSQAYIEGVATAVSTTGVTIKADATNGSGSYSEWNIGVAGQPAGSANESAYGAAIYARCTIANNATDANNDIDIGAGTEWVNNGSLWKPVSVAAITKRLDAAWSVGTNQGGLDTGSKANNTFYYIWVIHRSDTGVTDVLFSTSATSPTMPSGYDYKRRLRVGAMRTDGSGNIRAGTWHVDAGCFIYATSVSDLALTSGPFVNLVPVTAPPLWIWKGVYQHQNANIGVGLNVTGSTGLHFGRTQVAGLLISCHEVMPIRLPANREIEVTSNINTQQQYVSTFGFAE